MNSPHLWLALTPHGFGHAAMTAPVIEEMRRARPDLRLTIQTSIPRDFLETRYGPNFEHVTELPDFGLRMHSAISIDLDGSAEGYRHLHAQLQSVIAAEAARLVAARPDLVLANVPYVTIAAAAKAGLPVAALSSLEWADIYGHYLGKRPEAPGIMAEMVAAYNAAKVFIQVTPSMDMPSLHNLRRVGPVGRAGVERRTEVADRLGLGKGSKVGLIAFGGIDHDFDLIAWPVLEGWTWLTTLAVPSGRRDIQPWARGGIGFSDLIASVDVVVTKPGYGTFVEAALCRIPVLYVPRPDWPECPHLDQWLESNTRAMAASPRDLAGEGLEGLLRTLFSLRLPPLTTASGNGEAAEILLDLLDKG